MSNVHSVFPLDADIAEWLDGEGIRHSPPQVAQKYPVVSELRRALESLDLFRVELWVVEDSYCWAATVTSRVDPNIWAILQVDAGPMEGSLAGLYFRGGHHVAMFVVAERLAHFWGPLIIVSEETGEVHEVRAGETLEEYLASGMKAG